MDILIKSFNRPYYLDRCLYSIKKYIKGCDNIFILDDGTPEKYLKKILQKYSYVKILKSNLYDIKSNSVNDLHEFEIPIDLWVKSVEAASDYFLLLEDDFWVIEDLDLRIVNCEVKEKQIVFLKLMWLGNPKLIANRIKEKLEWFNIVNPKLITSIPYFFKLIFSTYGYKFNSLMRFLRLNSFDNVLPYYSIYSVAGSVFKKSYFTNLWANHGNRVDEGLQILNALKYLKMHPESQVAQAKKEYFKTGFKSSATFGVKKNSKTNLELLKVNYLLNESWMNNEFDVIKDLPNDLCETDIINVLSKEKKEAKVVLKWQHWVEAFKQQYREFGCKVE